MGKDSGIKGYHQGDDSGIKGGGMMGQERIVRLRGPATSGDRDGMWFEKEPTPISMGFLWNIGKVMAYLDNPHTVEHRYKARTLNSQARNSL